MSCSNLIIDKKMSYQKSESSSPTSPCPNDARGVRPLSVNLKDHCLICLEPEDPSVMSDILTKNPLSLMNFQPLVYYLTGVDPTNKEEETKLFRSNKYFPMITNLPPMCSICYQVLGEVYRLHTQLVDIQVKIQKQITIARKIVENTVKKDNPEGRLGATIRRNLFKKMGVGMRSMLSKEEMTDLRYFVENFHGLIIEAKNKFIFPSPPPPPDSSSKTQESSPPPSAAIRNLSYPVVFSSPSNSKTPQVTSRYSKTPPNSHSSTRPPQEHLSFLCSSSIQNSDEHRPSPPPSMPRRKLIPQSREGDDSHSIKSSPPLQSSHDTGSNTNSEMILVSGIDHNLKYEVEYDEDDDEMISEEENGNPANVMVILKEDLDEQAENLPHDDNHLNDTPSCDDERSLNIVKLENSNCSEEVFPDEEHETGPMANSNGQDCNDGYHVDQHRSGISSTPPRSSNSPSRHQIQPCDVCNETFNVSNLKSHIIKHGTDGWSCDICNRIYLSRSRLIQHFNGEGKQCGQKSVWYLILDHACSLCSSSFSTERLLHQHIFSFHELDKSLAELNRCKICGAAYRTKEGLDFHFNVHLHRAQRNEFLPVLEALIPPNCTPLLLSRPRKKYRQSSAVDDYTCELCGKKCVGSTSLLRHVKQVHKGQQKKTA